MGSLFGSRSKRSASTRPGGQSLTPSTVGPYPDDNAKRMPVFNSPESIEAGRQRRREITSRSGRESTRLVSDRGTKAFVNSFLGSA